jgi:hypothetical protein
MLARCHVLSTSFPRNSTAAELPRVFVVQHGADEPTDAGHCCGGGRAALAGIDSHGHWCVPAPPHAMLLTQRRARHSCAAPGLPRDHSTRVFAVRLAYRAVFLDVCGEWWPTSARRRPPPSSVLVARACACADTASADYPRARRPIGVSVLLQPGRNDGAGGDGGCGALERDLASTFCEMQADPAHAFVWEHREHKVRARSTHASEHQLLVRCSLLSGIRGCQWWPPSQSGGLAHNYSRASSCTRPPPGHRLLVHGLHPMGIWPDLEKTM